MNINIDEATDQIRRQLEHPLWPGVMGWYQYRGAPFEIWIPSLRAVNEGNGDVGKFLDFGLRPDFTYVVPLVTNPRLADMLDRRGFKLMTDLIPGIGSGKVWRRRGQR
jgi:hypothetical protein